MPAFEFMIPCIQPVRIPLVGDHRRNISPSKSGHIYHLPAVVTTSYDHTPPRVTCTGAEAYTVTTVVTGIKLERDVGAQLNCVPNHEAPHPRCKSFSVSFNTVFPLFGIVPPVISSGEQRRFAIARGSTVFFSVMLLLPQA